MLKGKGKRIEWNIRERRRKKRNILNEVKRLKEIDGVKKRKETREDR